jgi:polyvinyl alcohol dehydrogenase (cytochrome)
MRRVLVGAAAVALLPLAIISGEARAAETCAVADHAGGEWRGFGPDLGNSRDQPAETTIGTDNVLSLAPAWTFAGDGDSFTGTPVVADGCVYVGGGSVYALNADTGTVVWQTEVPSGGSINSTLGLDGGRVLALVSRVGSPYAIALDQATGDILWEQTLDTQAGSDSYSSPVVHDGILIAGVSGGSAELGDEADRYAFQGSYVLLESATGEILHKEWVVHDPSLGDDGFAGGGVWSTPAVDAASGFAYVGTANPFQPREEHEHTNAIIKIDLRRTVGVDEAGVPVANADFGRIVDSYKGIVDEYFPQLGQVPCQDIDGNPPPWYPQGAGACQDIDLDFGAAPNLFTDSTGRALVGAGQKAGVYHAVDPETMDGAWSSLVGPPGALGGVVGTAAVTASGIAGPITPGGYLWSVGKDSENDLQWVAPVADGLHWGHQTSHANGVVYTMDLKGFLQAYDAATGVLLAAMPLTSDGSGAGGLGGGVAIARNTVYAPANGSLVALRAGSSGGGGGGGGDVPEVPGVGLPDGVAPLIVSVPGSFAAGYVTRAMVAEKDGSLTYANLDVAQHDVVAYAKGPDGKPLFESDIIGVGQTTPVRGLDRVTAGQSYDFYCSLHPNMQGTLQILP